MSRCCVTAGRPVARALLPALLLAALPKCPLCVAAWLGVSVGVGGPLLTGARGSAWLALAVAAVAAALRGYRRRRSARAVDGAHGSV